VADKIEYLLGSMNPGGSVQFSSLFAEATSKTEVIVTFLAILELMKMNQFRIRQDTILGEIEVQRKEVV
jgi:segregation and condensation protein A